MPLFFPKPAFPRKLEPQSAKSEYAELFASLEHAYLMQDLDDAITDHWGHVNGVVSGTVPSMWDDGSVGRSFDGGGGSDAINLDDVPNFRNRDQFSILSVFSTNDDQSGSDPKILSVNDSGGSEKIRIDWDAPSVGEVARFRAIINATEREVVFSGAMQQNRFYTSIARFNGAALYFDLLDWNTDTLNSGTDGAAGTLDDVTGGAATIGNNAGTKNREWGGNLYAIFIWSKFHSNERSKWLLSHPYEWAVPDLHHATRRFKVAAAGAQVVTPTVVRLNASVQAPTITATGTASVTPTVVRLDASIQVPAVAGSDTATVTPTVVGATFAVQAPTVAATGSAPISPTVVRLDASVQAPTIAGTGNASVSPTVVSAIFTIIAPSVDAGAQVVTPTVVRLNASVQAPTVSGTGSAPVSPTVVRLNAAIQAPTIAGTGSASAITPTVISGVLNVQAPTVTATGTATISPTVVSGVFNVQAPAIAGTGSASVAPTVVGGVFTINTPSVTGGVQFVTPTVVRLNATIQAPTVAGSGSATALTPTVVRLNATVQAPTITATGSASVTPTVVSGTLTIQAPSIAGTGSAPISPTVVSAVFAIPSPVISGVTVGDPATFIEDPARPFTPGHIMSNAELNQLLGVQQLILSDTCDIQRNDPQRDAQGGVTDSWRTINQDTACRISAISGSERFLGNARHSDSMWVLTLASAQEIFVSDRVLVGMAIYEVTLVNEGRSFETVKRVNLRLLV